MQVVQRLQSLVLLGYNIIALHGTRPLEWASRTTAALRRLVFDLEAWQHFSFRLYNYTVKSMTKLSSRRLVFLLKAKVWFEVIDNSSVKSVNRNGTLDLEAISIHVWRERCIPYHACALVQIGVDLWLTRRSASKALEQLEAARDAITRDGYLMRKPILIDD